MIILLHTSKSMRNRPPNHVPQKPALVSEARELMAYLQSLSVDQLATSMHLSPKLAESTHALLGEWNDTPSKQGFAIDSFIGDIYSGLSATDLSDSDREYANGTLRILSGLYGVLRPLDGIYPYRLELDYKLPDPQFANLYKFWGERVANLIPSDEHIINLASREYDRLVVPYHDPALIVTPKFLTRLQPDAEPTFVTVHAKIARGACARWLITNRHTDIARLQGFDALGYCYDPDLSSPDKPIFVCDQFGGKGLSIRLR